MYVPPVMESLGVDDLPVLRAGWHLPNHLPNPEDPELTKDLRRPSQHGADFGIGFDGDADRCGLIDEHGHHVARTGCWRCWRATC